MNLTVLLPCLNEEKTIANCILKAQIACLSPLIDKYEILISDNGSTDNSVSIAKSLGARVVCEKRKGYGRALINGIKKAKYENIIMADSDDTYELDEIHTFIKHLNKYDIVIGDRFYSWDIWQNMSISHVLGNKFLSFIGRKLYKSNVRDFHCGIRAFNKNSIQKLNLHKSGMDFASEMICIAEKKKLKIKQIPTHLGKNIRQPHLRTIRDGLLHLKFLVSYC